MDKEKLKAWLEGAKKVDASTIVPMGMMVEILEALLDDEP